MTNKEKFISIDITNRCTHACIFCVVEGRNIKFEDQSLDKIADFLESQRKLGFDTVNLHGGEPTVYKNLDELLSLINSYGYKDIVIQTNSSKLQDKSFVEGLMEKNVKLFVISFHDYESENASYLTKSKHALTNATEGIKNVLKLGGDVRTNTVLVNSNYQRIKQIVDYIYDLEVRNINLSSLNPLWMWHQKKQELFDELAPTYNMMAPYLSEVYKAYDNKEVNITAEGFPFCFLEEYEKFNLYNTKRKIHLLTIDNQVVNYEEALNFGKIRLKKDECKTCKYDYKCNGVWKGYINYKGWDEFTPIVDEVLNINA